MEDKHLTRASQHQHQGIMGNAGPLNQNLHFNKDKHRSRLC